jgi:hypothetical protein
MACGCALIAYVVSVLHAPATAEFQLEQWANNSFGFHDIDRQRIWGTVAQSADGSRSNNLTWAYYRYYFVRSDQFSVHTIYLRPSNIAYEIDDGAKKATLTRCSCTWGAGTPTTPDNECAQDAEARLEDASRIATGPVAGVTVVRYRANSDEEEHEIAFAPRYGCEVMEETRTRYNNIGLPTSYFHMVIRSYTPGEPRKELFSPPVGYAVHERPRLR